MIQYGDDCFFYVSFFFYIVLILGVGLRINKVMAVSALAALPLFLLIMAVGTGVHRFIFEHVPYFKLIRNMHFFLPFFLAAMILLVSEQLRIYFEIREKLVERSRFVFLFFVAVVHATIGLFLSRQYGVVATSFLSLGLSLLFWVIFILGLKRWDAFLLPTVLFFSVIVQPCEVIWRHNQGALKASAYGNKTLIEECTRVPSVKPVFSYVRPVSFQPFGNDDTAYSRIAMKDASRFFENGFPSFWSYNLTLKEPFADLQQYTRYKFHVYDGEGLTENTVDLKTAAAVAGPSENFSVAHFDVNAIKVRTQYPGEKFLVYTDSYHKAWKAWVNGKPAVIERTNMAFKGLRLPPGTNDIEMRYSAPMMTAVSVSLSISLVLTLLSLLWFAAKERNTNEGKS
ncbi:MAG: YfhO family protein [Candidatus Omnitrophica bacterium]|nr:YfhO family protein [Candidatus Omnitrophota bacterium]